MQFGPLDFPESLLEAAAEGRLVVFAGAGVGMGGPARMPSFWQLCREIAEGLPAHLQPRDNEPEDQYLGRLADAEVPIHERAEGALRSRGTEPNTLHGYLLSLFPSADRCRLVTTNLETLFESAATRLWPGLRLEVYAAPALPFGGRFKGLACLHGRVGDPQRCLVLSDRDFSQAYLTEGWARRFLREVVAEFTVLFVGFSFNDVPSRYLLRGLPAAGRLYALTPRDEEAHVPRGVNLITFDKKDDYRSLRVGIRELAAFVRRDEASHYGVLRNIIGAAPPPAGPEADNLDWAVRQPTFAPLICQADDFLRRPWLDWVLTRGLLRPIFNRGASLSAPRLELTRWFWRMALRDDSWTACAEALGASKGELAPTAREALLATLASRVRDLAARAEPLGPREEFWLAVATGCPGPTLRKVSRDQLLFWKAHATAESLLELFEDATEPELLISSRIPFPGQEGRPAVQLDVGFSVDASTLRQFWEERCHPRLPDLALRLVALVHARLERAHRLLRMSDATGGLWDPASFARTEIADSPQNRPSDLTAFSTLIVAARDCMAWLAEHRPEVGQGLFEFWNQSPASLVRRIALFALVRLQSFPPDQVLARTVDEEWLQLPYAKPEVFAVLRAFYPAASDDARRRFVDSIVAALVDDKDAPEPERRAERVRIREYERFNLLHWLHLADPQCPFARAAVEESRARNPTFSVREHPDLDHWHGEGGRVEAVSPLSEQDLAVLSTTELLDLLRTLRANRHRGSLLVNEHQGLLDQVGRLASADVEWAFRITKDLAVDDGESRKLLYAILQGWRVAPRDPPAAAQILAWLMGQPWLTHEVEDVSPLVDMLLERSLPQLAEGDLQRAEALLELLWSAASPYDPGVVSGADWLLRAINQAQGQLALAAIHLASEWRRRQETDWTGLPAGLRTLLQEMVSGDPQTRPLGRVVVSSQLHFLFAADEQFAEAEVLPWFDWALHPEGAPQAWHGFLHWGQIYPALFDRLRPSLEQTFAHLEALGEPRNELSEFLAHYALDPEVEPAAEGWLGVFFAYAASHDRERWTSIVAGDLEQRGAPEATRAWSAWLGAWVEERLATGYPAVSTDELKAFYRIVLVLPGPALATALSLLRGHPLPASDTSYELSRLEKRVDDLTPDDLADLLLLILQNSAAYLLVQRETAIRDKLALAAPDRVAALRALLVRLNRTDLADRIIPPDGTH
jgi:hypothetical protein